MSLAGGGVRAGGVSADGSCCIAYPHNYLVLIAVLSILFGGRMLGMPRAAHAR